MKTDITSDELSKLIWDLQLKSKTPDNPGVKPESEFTNKKDYLTYLALLELECRRIFDETPEFEDPKKKKVQDLAQSVIYDILLKQWEEKIKDINYLDKMSKGDFQALMLSFITIMRNEVMAKWKVDYKPAGITLPSAICVKCTNPVCKAENPLDAIYCMHCGQKLEV